MSSRKYILAVLVIGALISSAYAGLTAPTTYSVGYKMWSKYWDMMGENGIMNGTIGGVGKNVTFLDSSGSALGTAKYTIINVTQNYTIANSSMTLFNVSAKLGTVNVTLPIMTGSGNIFTVTKTDASSASVNINVTGNCCIDGAAWANITTQYESIDLVDINSMWKIT